VNYESKPKIMKRVILTFILLATFIFSYAGNFDIYPNPAANEISINSTSQVKSIEIFNLLGSKVFSKEIQNFESVQNLNISKLKEGRYFVKIVFLNNTSEVTTLIKK